MVESESKIYIYIHADVMFHSDLNEKRSILATWKRQVPATTASVPNYTQGGLRSSLVSVNPGKSK